MYNYAAMIRDGKVFVDFNGESFGERTKEEVAADLYRKAKTPESKNSYALMIEKEEIFVDFNGESFGERTKDEVAAALYREAKTPQSKHNYAVMIEGGKVSVDFNGESFGERTKDEVAADLYRKAKTPQSKNNYALMIRDGKVSVDFNGKSFGGRTKDEVAGALYREANIPYSQFNFFCLMLNGYIKETFEKDRMLSDEEIPQYIINYLEQHDHVYNKEVLLALAKAKNIKTEEGYKEVLQLCKENIAAGKDDSENLYEALTSSSDINSQEMDEQDESDEENTSLNSDTATQEEETSAKEEKSVTRKEKKAREETERKRKCDEQTKRRYQDFKSHKTERLKRVQPNLVSSEKERPYAIEFKCDIDASLRGSSSFQKLIGAIKNRTNEGHPEILRAKHLKQQCLKESTGNLRFFSRRLTGGDRIVYTYNHADHKAIVFQVEGHYGD